MSGRRITFRVLASLLASVLLASALLQPAAMSAQGIRVIVQGKGVGAAAAAVADLGGQVEADIPMIDAVVVRMAPERLDALQADGRIVRVTPDRTVELADKASYSSGGGNAVDVEFSKPAGLGPVWATGDLGAGVTVAILDTGVDPRFPELRGMPQGRGDRFLAYYDAIADPGKLYEHPHLLKSPRDPNGHGSHVAGIIANSDYEGADSEYRGVAPAANIVAVRVLNKDGVGSYVDVLEGIQWVVDNAAKYNIRVLNISMYAIPIAPYWADPYNLAVMAAWNAGITVVASVGNTGPGPMSVGVPGNTPYIITVGAFTDHRTPEDFSDDYIPEFSAAGPTLDAFVKPDVIAPGAHVVSLMRPNTTLRDAYADNRVNGRYFEMSGSSMSTAVVSGIASLVLSEHGGLTPDEVKYRITQTARPQMAEVDGQATAAYSIWQQGAGRVWAADAVLSGVEGAANQGMDLQADLSGDAHYQGWTTYDPEVEEFKIIGGGFDAVFDGYTTWSGSFDSWADGYDLWADGDTNWSGSFDSWADSFDSWADSFDSWADSFDSWADSFDSWADSYDEWVSTCTVDQTSFDSWADSFDSWADSFDSWADFEFWVGSFDSWADFSAEVEGTGAESDVALLADSFDSWADFVGWVDSFDSWADFVAWTDSFDSWADSFDSWADSFDSWADFVAQADSFDSWADSFDSWADSFGSWADSFDSWADDTEYCDAWVGSFDSWADAYGGWADGLESMTDGLATWTGAFGTWEGGYLTWSNSFDSWADSFDSWADGYSYWVSACSVDGASFDSWADSFDSWADSFDSWADLVAWVGSFDSWADFIAEVEGTGAESDVALLADSFDSWADFVVWVDSFDSWADFEAWTDSFDSWADSFDSWADSFDSWADSFDSWADYIAWVDSFDSWADSFDSWADSFDSWADSTVTSPRPVLCEGWSDSFDSWADSFDSWADSFDSWADATPALTGSVPVWEGGYTTWAGGPEAWSAWPDSFDSWADQYIDPVFAIPYRDVTDTLPMSSVPLVSINLWVDVE